MARLIPRKQIEEQQNITGSLTIAENVFVGSNAIISGSLFVSKSFFLGNNTGSKSEITGSVFLTGSLEIDGNLVFRGPEAILSATSSNALLAVDTQRYAGILAKDFGANVPTLYVSSTDGDDNNDGRTIQYPLRTIKRAAALAQPGYDGRYGFDTGSIQNGYVIKVQAGTYLEDNPVILPKNTTIWGAGLRITKINAKNPEQDLFWVNSGCYVAEVTVGGLRLWPNQINPERGFGFAFQPGAFITTSPYIQNCSQISNQENSFTELYEDIPPGGGGLYVNGDVIDPDSPLASMVLDAYTQISPNGVGCLVNGRGFIQLVSFFNNFSYYAIRVNNGGHATLNNSNISFGLFGMYASGSRLISGSGGNLDARNRVRASWSVVVDVLNKGLDALPEITTLNTAEGIRITSPSQFPQYTTSSNVTLSSTAAEEISSDFKLVSAIVESGNSNFPTLLARSSNKGYGFESPYNILGREQITGSLSGSSTPLSASKEDLNQISSSFGVILGIFANGTGSYDFKPNTSASIRRTLFTPQPASPALSNDITSSVSSSFETIIDIIKNGLSAVPKVTSSVSSSYYVGNLEPLTTGISSSLEVTNKVSSSFSIIYNVLANGTGSNIEPIPTNHKRNYTITNNGSSSYQWQGVGDNPTITLFRGETYKFSVSASAVQGGFEYPFYIRTKPVATIEETFDYNKGVINNGDSVGTITFAVPYDAPNTLYYTSQTDTNLSGKFNIINNIETPRELIANTLTYPATISGSLASEDTDILNAYEILTGSKAFIQEEVIEYVNSAWSGVDGFTYDEAKCRRDVGFLIDAVAQDLLFGGNDKSITAGRFYYEYPSEATTTQKDPTKTAVKYAAQLSQQLIKNVEFKNILINAYSQKRKTAWEVINDNKQFVQNETIAFLSSSWSNFSYNEAKCKRDVGYILDAVATDTLYGGNERAIEAGQFYYLYPSLAIVEGDGDSEGQLGQTLDGIRYAAGIMTSLVAGKTFTLPSTSSQAAYSLIRRNKDLIQDEVIEFVNVAYPQLKYNQSKCRRDVGYILDAISTDLLYGGNERSVTAGRYYYEYPSIATSTQRRETSGGIRYAKIITDYIVQNIILETPRIIYNDEKNIRVTNSTNVTSSNSGTSTQQYSISSSFSIIEGIIKKGIDGIQSVLAQNTNLNWSQTNPISVTTGSQTTSSFTTPAAINKIGSGFDIVNTIIAGGIAAEPAITYSQANTIKVTSIEQYTGSVEGPANDYVKARISESISLVGTIITNGTGSVPAFSSNVVGNIKVTATTLETLAIPATTAESQSISSSMKLITDVLVNGKSAIPALTSSLSQNIFVSNTQPQTATSSISDVLGISSSISLVTKIIEIGESAVVAKTPYSSSVVASRTAAYNAINANIKLSGSYDGFIQNETIAYLSSSWSGFVYDEAKCRRDVGLIISGAIEDLLQNSNSASIVNGQFYYEFPSAATGSQLAQTLDGINYASRLAQKIISDVSFQQLTGSRASASLLILNNKDFIADETIAYMSSSWGSFDYNETTCRRDIGYILDAVRTDIIYGGNERTRIAADYYFTYPSAATGSQLTQTIDAINYASRIAQKIVVGQTFTQAATNFIDASELIRRNKALIAAEVVEYVSSSWSDVFYNEDKCKRDVGYILDAVRTDLVYGGNERSVVAGEFYYRYPSSATVGGVPSATQQLDPTITGIYYANQLLENILMIFELSNPSAEVLAARNLVKQNRAFIQQNTIDFVNSTYPSLDYNQSKCFRDVGFIIDNVLTDLVYGGNERAITAGRFYYLYPSQATDAQVQETTSAVSFARDLAKLVGLGGKPIEDGFDIVAKTIASGSSTVPTLVLTTDAGIKKTNETQFVTSSIVNTNDKLFVSQSFGNVINIVDKGISGIPTIVSASNKGVIRLSDTQITSSITPTNFELEKVKTGFNTIINVIGNGTSSLPNLVNSSVSLIKSTTYPQFVSTASISSTFISASNNNFNIVLDVVKNGTGSLPTLVKNIDGLVKITNQTQYSSSVAVSKSLANNVSASFNRVIGILENGIGTLPTIVSNTIYNIKVTDAQQYISASSATNSEVSAISASISIVTNIIANGTNPAIISASLTLPTSSYSTPTNDNNKFIAYGILKNNIAFIQDEVIAYLSSSWSTASYNEEKCRRDVGLIISGAAEDLIWNSNSSSVVNGKFYYDYPSQAQGAQLNQTLDGVFYASKLAQKVILNTQFVLPNSQSLTAYDLLINNKSFIQEETIAYLSSSWASHSYNETTCKRDIGYILDAVATDTKWGGTERSIKAGVYYYLYPSAATGSQLEETLTGIEYARDIADKILRGNVFSKPSQNKLQAKELIVKNKGFIADEVIAYVSASWSTASYNEETCKRDVGYILDAIATDIVYGGNERSREAGKFYYEYPSQATTSQLGPTLTGIRHAKNMTEQVLNNRTFVTASNEGKSAYELLSSNRELIQTETIGFLDSAWSFFQYDKDKCKRDVGYIIDAVATDVLYGGNERSREAGEYYYLYPSLATVDGDGDSEGQLGQTLDGIKFAKGLAEKIVKNIELVKPTNSEYAAWNLLRTNKTFIQKETIAFLSSSWSGIGGFSYNEASCSRDVAYIIDNVATDLLYGGNERSSKAGEYYYLYPSAATVTSSISPTTSAQKGPTLDGIGFAAGISQKVISNQLLVQPTEFVSSSYNLMKQNRTLIQNETIQFIDAFYPYLIYNKEKCKRDVGYIIDNVATDLWYGGNQRSIIAGDYYYRYPSKATTNDQVVETVAGVEYAKILTEKIVQNIILQKPTIVSNTTANIKVGNINQITSSISATNTEVNVVSSSFTTVTQIIENGLDSLPTIISNNEARIKVSNLTPTTSASSATLVEVGIVTASFGLIRDIVYWGSSSIPDSLANNFQYGFNNTPPSLLHISEVTQSLGSGTYNSQVSNTSASYASIINIINNGTGSIPSLVANTSSSIKVTSENAVSITGSINEVNKIGNLFGIVLKIVENGTTSIPTLISNTSASIKITDTPQIISGSVSGSRLQGKLISSSFAYVIDALLNEGTSSIPYEAPSLTANGNARVIASYNLLKDNTPLIVSESIAFMSSSWSSFQYDQSKCERDLGLIISGAAFDLLYGGNSASFVNGKYYFESASAATGSQLDQTITALKYASGLAEKVVQNKLLEHFTSSILQPVSSSWASLRTNKGFIVSESIAYLSSSWQGFEYNQSKCERDLGYIIDAVATDLLYGGNERSVIAGRYYYDFPSQATDEQLEPTLTGVRYARGLAMIIVSGSTFSSPDSNNLYAYNLVKNNKSFIQEETVAFVNAKWPELDYIESKCRRDVGYIVDAVATDLLYGGNERSNKAGEFYYLYPSLAIESEQVVETTTAVDYARRLTAEVINSNLVGTPQIIPNGVTPSTNANVVATYDLLITNKSFIQAETIAYVSSSWVGFLYNEASCSRDVGHIIDAVATDVLYGGNESSANAGLVYYLTASAATGSQLEPTVDAIDYAGGLASKLIQNLTFNTSSQIVSASVSLLRSNREFIQEETMHYLTSSWANFDYNKEKCRRDIGHILDGVATDLLYGGNERSVMSGEFYFRYPSKATLLGDGDGEGQLKQTLDGINYASRISQKVVKNTQFVTASQAVSSSVYLLRENKNFIAAETIAYVSSSWSGVKYNEASCSRDVKYLIDAATTDLLYGGQERSVNAGTYYYLFPSRATNKGVPSEQNQLDPTLTGVRYAGRLSSKVVTNPNFVNIYAVSQSLMRTTELLTLNKSLIQKETITFLSSSWSTLKYNEVSCSRDLGFIIDAIRTDLVYGGNERSIEAGSYYYKIPSVAIAESYTDNGEVGQKKQTVDGINFARGISEKVVNNTLLTYLAPSNRRRQAAARLIGAKEELKQRAIGYTNGAFPYLVYNEASCSRDTGLIVDACATDLLYGGNERAIAAASSYYTGQYGSAQAVISSQKLETLETNRYLRTRAEFIAAGAPLEPFGSLIVATGIDYSYNGSGVTFKALPPNQGGSGQANPAFEITELGGGRIFFTSGNQDGDFRIGTGLSINQATGTLVGRTFSKSLFSLVTPFSLALQI